MEGNFVDGYHTKKQINKKPLAFKNIMENGKMKKENKTNIQFLEIEIKSPLSSYSIKFYRSLGFFIGHLIRRRLRHGQLLLLPL